MSNVSFHSLYLYDHVYELLVVDNNPCLCSGDWGPMNNTSRLKAHKGIDNELIFRVLGPDRSPVDISCNQQVYGRIIDPENKCIVLEKLCRLGPATGVVKMEIDAGDITDIHAGIYNLVMIRTQNFVSDIPDYYTEKPLFSDMDDNVALQLEITEQALKTPPKEIVLYPQDWTPDILVSAYAPPMPCFFSPRIPGARVLNHKDSVHTFSIYTQGFSGRLELWGTLQDSPDPYLNDSLWFKVWPSSMSQDIQFTNYTGTTGYTFQNNAMWFKFRYFPSTSVLDPGIMNKVIIRP